MPAPTLSEIREWPAVVSVPKAATAIGCSKSYLHELIKRGESPLKTLAYGRRHVVVTASILTLLEGA
ncbi:DNA-binding protein [Streptomyces scabiei]|uniref:DNA-binding protein n=1 Tax=Streptomyces scabiei TaxID=1930 RepID=UPI0033F4132A